MQFEYTKKTETPGRAAGFIAGYLLFTGFAYALLSVLHKLPAQYPLAKVVLGTLIIVGIGIGITRYLSS